MRALKGRGLKWQAGVTSKLARDDRMLELAAESGCTLLSIGFESLSRKTLRSVHKHVNQPDQFAALVEKVHSYGISSCSGSMAMIFRPSPPPQSSRSTPNSIACAHSALTPCPGTLTWYEMRKANRIVSYDWTKYDQGHVVYKPAQMSATEVRQGIAKMYHRFYSASSMASRFPLRGRRDRTQWAIYNLFMHAGARTENIGEVTETPPSPTELQSRDFQDCKVLRTDL